MSLYDSKIATLESLIIDLEYKIDQAINEDIKKEAQKDMQNLKELIVELKMK